MEIIHLSRHASAIPDACVTALGFFDGVHRGHRALLSRTVSLAKKMGYAPAVFTFAPTEQSYKTTARLSTPEEQLSLFEACGITHVFYADFNALRDLSPDAFVSEILIRSCHTAIAVCGYNFRFGRGASGDARELKRLMHTHGRRISVIPQKTLADGAPISSSDIRRKIEAGDMASARAMLGRAYSLTSPVLHGKALGRTIGFPTINQAFPKGAVIPAHGVYDVSVDIDGMRYRGLANVGTRPTVEEGANVNCETHIIDFSGDLYDKTVTTRFVRMLRREMHFSSLAELQAAINENLKEIKNYYGK